MHESVSYLSLRVSLRLQSHWTWTRNGLVDFRYATDAANERNERLSTGLLATVTRIHHGHLPLLPLSYLALYFYYFCSLLPPFLPLIVEQPSPLLAFLGGVVMYSITANGQ